MVSNSQLGTILALGLLVFAPCAYGAMSQADINLMARTIEIRYTVTDNMPADGMRLTIALKNNDVNGMVFRGWDLYFSNIRVLQPSDLLTDGGTYITRKGTMLESTGLMLYHINGVLFKITATAQFTGIPAGGTLELNLAAQAWAVSRTDVMPNWYFVAEGTEPRIIDNTSGQSLDFVTDFTTEKQYKRSTTDKYSPYSAEDRYNRYGDIQSNTFGTRIVPSVLHYSQNAQAVEIIDDWSVVPGTSQFAAKLLADKLGLKLIGSGETVPTNRLIELKIDATAGSRSECTDNKETYTISVDATMEKITITGRQDVGVFYGVQSLLSYINWGAGKVYVDSVEDCPRFGYRGMHVDTARNFFSKATILKLLDAMSAYKLNRFHFHITDDEGWRLEIPGIEELTEIGARRCHDPDGDKCIMPQLGAAPNGGGSGSGFYTVDDYKEILAYANERHIKVIPEFDMPGHSHAAINAIHARERKTGDKTYLLVEPGDTSRYLSVQTFIDNAINPCINSTYVFIQKIIDEIKKMHQDIQPLDIFNFGGDEVAATAWVNSTACNNLKQNGYSVEKKEIKKHFAERTSVLADASGMALAGWEDGLMYDGAQNLPFNLSGFATKDVYAYTWNNIWEWGAGSRAYRLANAGYKTVIGHGTNFYFDHPNEPDPEERGYYWATRCTDTKKVFGFMPDSVYDNIDFNLMGDPITKDEVCKVAGSCPALEKKENIIGLQGHLWSETVRTAQQFEAMVFPRLLALAERAWHKASWESETDINTRNQRRDTDWHEWSNLVGQKELVKLDDRDINYHILPAGAKLESTTLKVRSEFPGLSISISRDNGATWTDVKKEIQVQPGDNIQFYTKSADGRRQSRMTKMIVPSGQGNLAIQHKLSCVLAISAIAIGFALGR